MTVAAPHDGFTSLLRGRVAPKVRVKEALRIVTEIPLPARYARRPLPIGER
jgi:hypothetical protein